MDMGTMAMNMGGDTPTAAATSAATASAASILMHGECKISMLWNWYTIDACFLSRSWHIHSRGAFIASCLGVTLLVMTLELLRRLSKEYDRYLLLCQPSSYCPTNKAEASELLPSSSFEASDKPTISQIKKSFRPNLLQQAVRATLHMLQFGLAYLIMLLAMYYNGFVIISIVVGAWLGAFVFGWESIGVSGPQEEAAICCG